MSKRFNEIDAYLKNKKTGYEDIEIIKEGIKLADEEKVIYSSYELRDLLIHISSAHGDGQDAILTFPKYLWVVDNYSDVIKSSDRKYIIFSIERTWSTSSDYYQIKLEDIEMLEKEYFDRAQKYGYSLRYYYDMKTHLELDNKNFELAKSYYEKFKSCKRDELSDCEQCEKTLDLKYELLVNNNEAYIDKIFKLLKSKGKDACDGALYSTHFNAFEYYLDKHRLEEAGKYNKETYKFIKKDMSELYNIIYNFRYYALTKPKEGIKIFIEQTGRYLENKNPLTKFNFSLGTWILFEKIKKVDKEDKCKMLLPKELPFYNADGDYKYDELIRYFKNETINLAQKFDERNRNHNLKDKIKEYFTDF